MNPSLDVIAFEPIPMERVWGGRRIETTLKRRLPTGVPVGESWEIVDREDVQSVVSGGPFAGTTLHALWTDRRAEVFGADYENYPSERFPILIKVLDARERLSVQVHPPAAVAPRLGGEPKTEMWYFLDCLPGAAIYAGLKRGISRSEFLVALENGEVEATLHRAPVQAGDRIFIPSGRLHAIGEGCLIIEIQQNSDTTYRVFDWNRVGLDGMPRALHLAESMESIDFDDLEPSLGEATDPVVAACDYFEVERRTFDGESIVGLPRRFTIWTVVSGGLESGGRLFRLGSTFLVPAVSSGIVIRTVGGQAQVLRTILPLPSPER